MENQKYFALVPTDTGHDEIHSGDLGDLVPRLCDLIIEEVTPARAFDVFFEGNCHFAFRVSITHPDYRIYSVDNIPLGQKRDAPGSAKPVKPKFVAPKWFRVTDPYAGICAALIYGECEKLAGYTFTDAERIDEFGPNIRQLSHDGRYLLSLPDGEELAEPQDLVKLENRLREWAADAGYEIVYA
jgi:hypothetical protein